MINASLFERRRSLEQGSHPSRHRWGDDSRNGDMRTDIRRILQVMWVGFDDSLNVEVWEGVRLTTGFRLEYFSSTPEVS